MRNKPENFEVFKNAPIKEAIFDIRINPQPLERVNKMDILKEQFKNDFPVVKPIQIFEKKITFGEQISQSETSQLVGFQLWATNQNELHTIRLDGFSYNKLQPYANGEEAIHKTLSGWKTYKSVFTDIETNRLSVRNINVIEFKSSRVDLDDYFEKSPDVPSRLAQRNIINFFWRFTLQFEEENAFCDVIMRPDFGPQGLSVVLDIDAHKPVTSNATEADIIEEFSLLRSVKDQVFFGLIKPKCAELFR